MLFLLLGPDDFSKRLFVSQLAEKAKAGLEFFGADDLPAVDRLVQQDLFSKPKISVVVGLVEKFNDSDVVERLISATNQVVFIQEKLDKRVAANKELLKNSKITVKEFILPHGKELDKWITSRVGELGGKIASAAADLLAKKLGRDEAKETKFGGKVVDVEEIYSLWQADGEVKKLIALAKDREISAEDVENLSGENLDIDVFEVTNAIADNKKDLALSLLHRLLRADNASDEKAGVIQLNALLSEQFRNVAMVQGFLQSSVGESEILEQTGWKSGRLFVMKKIAANFPPKKVLDFLSKLEALDEELKTGNTPPKVLLDLIVAQLF